MSSKAGMSLSFVVTYIPHTSRMDAGFQETSGREQTLTLACIAPAVTRVPTAAYSVFWRVRLRQGIVSNNCRYVKESVTSTILQSYPRVLFWRNSQLLRKSPSLQTLAFQGFVFKEVHCRALETLERNDLKVKLSHYTIEPQDADENTFID
jgi:hypothetical protein